MREKTLWLIILLFVFVIISIVDTHAEIYKHIDKDGRITYSNQTINGTNKSRFDPSAPRIHRDREKSNENYPNVNKHTQDQRDFKRRQILENELATENKLLVNAKQSLINAEKNAKVSKIKAPHILPSITKYKKEIKNRKLMHKRNITALKKELAK